MPKLPQFSRRDLIRVGTTATAAFGGLPLLAAKRNGPAQTILSLNRDWLFGGKLNAAALEPSFDDSGFSRVTLPHCVDRLSWQNWDPTSWENVWVYRRHFSLPHEFGGRRVFLHFDGVMTASTSVINGRKLPRHLGGFLPFRQEITGLITDKNVLAVAVDSRWLKVPPEGSPKGPASIDYLLPGGITGSVQLRAVPQVFISDVFAKPVNVLDSTNRRLQVTCSLDAGTVPRAALRLVASLRDDSREIASASTSLNVEKPGETQALMTLAGLENVKLWHVSAPRLYEVAVTLFLNDQPIHEYRTRFGFREARFELDGFFLNGRRLQLFGLNRHELYPYVGRAMPHRVLRKDAEILRNEFNCNVVRCSHYPQSEAFLDACDELGLMVWEEIPGWQYVGDEAWQDLAVRDVEDMVRRDRNHPSIIIWGVRINESRNDPALYQRTKRAAKSLDDSRPTSGSMVYRSTQDWLQDVFAYDDYHAASDGSVGLIPPLPGVPFFFSEAVGQFSYGAGHGFNNKYRRAGDLALQQKQALYHAQVHDRGASNKRYCGVIAWCAFEYGSLLGAYQAVKYPGVADVFRIPKLGASFYRAQVDPKVRAVIEPNFYWDFGPRSPSGPGEQAAIFSNCDSLELTVDGKPHAVLHPDRDNFPHLKYPPFFTNLTMPGAHHPELQISGFVGEKLAFSRSFSSDTAADQLLVRADDSELLGDGSDATRLVFRITDKFGAPRPFVGGEVQFQIDGPGVIVGDNPFHLTDSGGLGAVWIKALPGGVGRIHVEVLHALLGHKSIEIDVRKIAEEA